MGRRPNPLILRFFERGAKLNDSSNRYHYRCRSCGEDFPKGRPESLIGHLTKKCPAISEANRINALLVHAGLGESGAKYDGLLHSGPNRGPASADAGGLSIAHNAGQPHHGLSHASPSMHQPIGHAHSQAQNQMWTPLETLAEVSRQIEANEKHDNHPPATLHDPSAEAVQTTLAAAIPNMAAASANQQDLQEQFTMENPPLSYNNQHSLDKRDSNSQKQPDFAHHELSAEEQRLQQLLQSTESSSQTALSVAAAATARLTSSNFETHMLSDAALAEQVVQAAPSSDMIIDYPEHDRAHINQLPHATPPPEAPAPWGGMTYMAEDIHGPATVTDHGSQLGTVLNRGGHRMDTTSSPNDSHRRSRRSRFNLDRRKEVQEVRRIGACIRCRILRKVCSRGTPCDTCKKVLSPRVWRTGCVRTKLSERIDLYSAGVQVVMSQKRINDYKSSYHLENTGAIVEVSHFHETGHTVQFQVFQGMPKEADGSTPKMGPHVPVVLIDNDREDIPVKVEAYMRKMLPHYIAHEPSDYVRLTLEVADNIAKETNDELLKRSLELWGIVEMMDRERQWTMLAKYPGADVEDHWIKDDPDTDAYSNISMQLTAAAERKASLASKNLLNGIQRILQDGKTKLGFSMFLTVLLFLNCLEKTTWAFKAWDQENLRPKWPLERPPSSYTNQGHSLTELLRMLLSIRHILPKTFQSDPDMPVSTDGEDPMVQRYFAALNVTPRYLRMRYGEHNFQPTDSRSLEFLFCAQLLLSTPLSHNEFHPMSLDDLHATPDVRPHGMSHVAPHGMAETNHHQVAAHNNPQGLPGADVPQMTRCAHHEIAEADTQAVAHSDHQAVQEANAEALVHGTPQAVHEVHDATQNVAETIPGEGAYGPHQGLPETNPRGDAHDTREDISETNPNMAHDTMDLNDSDEVVYDTHQETTDENVQVIAHHSPQNKADEFSSEKSQDA